MKESKKIYFGLEYWQNLLFERLLFEYWYIKNLISAFHVHLHHLNLNTL
jgi:hypothetical protein